MMPRAETSRLVVNFMCFFGGAVGVEDFLEAFWLGREQDYPELFPALRWQLEGIRALPYTPREFRFFPTLDPLRTFSTSTVPAPSLQYGGASLGPRLWLVLPLCLLKTSETPVGTGMLLQRHFPQGELALEDFSWNIECLNLRFTARSALLFHLWGTFMGVEQWGGKRKRWDFAGAAARQRRRRRRLAAAASLLGFRRRACNAFPSKDVRVARCASRPCSLPPRPGTPRVASFTFPSLGLQSLRLLRAVPPDCHGRACRSRQLPGCFAAPDFLERVAASASPSWLAAASIRRVPRSHDTVRARLHGHPQAVQDTRTCPGPSLCFLPDRAACAPCCD